MDTLNDRYPLYPNNPDKEGYTEVDLEETNNYANNLNASKRKRPFHYDEWQLKYSDDLWYLWCILNESIDTNSLNILDIMDFSSFCTMCYENSSKY